MTDQTQQRWLSVESVRQWFATSGNAAMATFLMSLVALALSVMNTWRQMRSDREQKAKSKAAQLIAHLVKEMGSGGRLVNRLRIENVGQAEAREIQITLDDLPILQHKAIYDKPSPLVKLPPGSWFNYGVSITFGCAPPWNIVITWKDDSRSPGRYESTLTL